MTDKQSPMYKKPTEKQREAIKEARKMTREGMEGEKDIISRFSTTQAKAARDHAKAGRKKMENIPEEVRRYEGEEGQKSSPYQKGGAVKSTEKDKKEKAGFFKQGLEDLKDSVQTVADDIHMALGTKRGKMKEEYLDKKYPYRGGTGLKSGGYVKAADGCAKKGKTKGRMV